MDDPPPAVTGGGNPGEAPGIFLELPEVSVLKLEEWNSRSSWCLYGQGRPGSRLAETQAAQDQMALTSSSTSTTTSYPAPDIFLNERKSYA